MNQETIGFSLHLSTFYSINVRTVSEWCHDAADLTYNEFSLLYSLVKTEDEIGCEDLADFLMLERSSVMKILIALEDRGYVVKKSDPSDARLMLVSISPLKSDCVRTLVKQANEWLLRCFGPNPFESELPQASVIESMLDSLDALRGFAVPSVGQSPVPESLQIDSQFLVFNRGILEKWDALTREKVGLSLTEYRMLVALDQQKGFGVVDLSAKLSTSKSTVSLCKQRLVGLKLVKERKSTGDGRSIALEITKKGRQHVNDAKPSLDELTRAVHLIGTDDAVVSMQAWHSIMYGKARRALSGSKNTRPD